MLLTNYLHIIIFCGQIVLQDILKPWQLDKNEIKKLHSRINIIEYVQTYIEYVIWILWPRKPYPRHQNYISMILSSWEKWTCMICRPSWTPSWISRNCQGQRSDTIIFLVTGDLLKRSTPLAYLYHFAAHGNTTCCWTIIDLSMKTYIENRFCIKIHLKYLSSPHITAWIYYISLLIFMNLLYLVRIDDISHFIIVQIGWTSTLNTLTNSA